MFEHKTVIFVCSEFAFIFMSCVACTGCASWSSRRNNFLCENRFAFWRNRGARKIDRISFNIIHNRKPTVIWCEARSGDETSTSKRPSGQLLVGRVTTFVNYWCRLQRLQNVKPIFNWPPYRPPPGHRSDTISSIFYYLTTTLTSGDLSSTFHITILLDSQMAFDGRLFIFFCLGYPLRPLCWWLLSCTSLLASPLSLYIPAIAKKARLFINIYY